jgi:hypothetical protein
MVPYMPLLQTITISGSRFSTAVMNSSPVIWKQPSPANAITVRSGCSSLAATAAGRP